MAWSGSVNACALLPCWRCWFEDILRVHKKSLVFHLVGPANIALQAVFSSWRRGLEALCPLSANMSSEVWRYSLRRLSGGRSYVVGLNFVLFSLYKPIFSAFSIINNIWLCASAKAEGCPLFLKRQIMLCMHNFPSRRRECAWINCALS